jgi:hypothetical protein
MKILNFESDKRGGNSMTILERMNKLGISQVEMIKRLRERGTVVQPPEMSNILREVYTYPKSKRVLNECDAILSDLERTHQ